MTVRKLLFILIIIVVIFAGYRVLQVNHKNASSIVNKGLTDSTSVPQFDKKKYSINVASSIWTIVNKQRQISPTSYAPNDLMPPNVLLRLGNTNPEMMLRKSTSQAVEEMFADAKTAKINLVVASGYRSFTTQKSVYNSELLSYGVAKANLESAKPGYSEHQTGNAVDIMNNRHTCEIIECFGNTIEGKWLAANSYKYGFILRYPKDKTAVTGYVYEPWHFRYVGKDLSNEMRKQKISTLEEFFNLPDAPTY